jgi:hypothetical protein
VKVGRREPERRAVISAALGRRAYRDAFRAWTGPLHGTAYRWCRRVRRGGQTPSSPTIGPAATEVASLDVKRALSEARRLYWVNNPYAVGRSGTFRAAGGRRRPWPEPGKVSGDREDQHAWHRLYWVLEEWSPETVARLTRWLREPLRDEALHPYTTSERIHVIAEMLGTLGEDRLGADLTKDLVARLLMDADWLYERIETHLGVHNHLLNNARALCTAAYLLPHTSRASAWLGLARNLWDEIWPQLILEDGVFAEQSSHYHVLLTRTLLQYLRDACLADRSLPSEIWEKGRAMSRVSNALVRPDGTLPLFGDVSPDLPTMWLRGLPVACYRAGLLPHAPQDGTPGYAAGASAFFRGSETALIPPKPGHSGHAEWPIELYPSGGLLFTRHARSGIQLAAHGDPRPRAEGHGDSGRGSFELWFGGRRIVVDGGMPTYAPGEIRRHFRSAAGQNVIAVDGLAPAVLKEEESDLPAWYLDGLGGGAWRAEEGQASFTWHGFGRYRPGLVWTRTWRWGESRVAASDRLDGWTGEAHVEGRLHFGESVWSTVARGEFGAPGCRLSFTGPPSLVVTLTDMPYAPDYGVLVQSQGLCMSGRVRLPAEWTWHFEFEAED